MRHFVLTGVAIAMSAALYAQATQPPPQSTTTTTKEAAGAATVTTDQMAGEVIFTQGNWLFVRMLPNKEFRLFNVPVGREFLIDGQKKLVGDLKPGTVLIATVTTTNQPVTVRTMTNLEGTVWYASGNHVILTLPNGENKSFIVPENFRFTVQGKPATVFELKPGMKVSATKIVAEPQTDITTKTVVTGRAIK